MTFHITTHHARLNAAALPHLNSSLFFFKLLITTPLSLDCKKKKKPTFTELSSLPYAVEPPFRVNTCENVNGHVYKWTF